MDSELWPAALSEILKFVGNSGTHLWLMDGNTSEVSHSIHVGMPDMMIEEYNGEVIKECPRWANARQHPERTFLFDYQHITEKQINSNEYYHWLQTRGDSIRYYLGGRLNVADTTIGFQSLAFRKSEGHSQKRHLERFSRLLPHVQHAMQIGQKLGTWRLVTHSAVESLNRLSHGVMVLDSGGKVLMLNSCAERLLKSPCRLSLKANRLVALDPGADQQLRALILRCVGTHDGTLQFPGGTMVVPAKNCAESLQIQAYPMRLPAGIQNIEAAAVILFLFGPPTTGPLDETTLRGVFAMTSAESRLVAAMLRGMSVIAASQHLKISVNTARTQLKSVFARLGVNRQSDLVRVVMPFVTRSGI